MLEEVAKAVHLARQLGQHGRLDQGDIDHLYYRYQNAYGNHAPSRQGQE